MSLRWRLLCEHCSGTLPADAAAQLHACVSTSTEARGVDAIATRPMNGPAAGGHPDPATTAAMRVAVIGLGAGAQRIMLPGLASLPDIRLVAACDLDATNRQRAATSWRIPNLYADAREMLVAEQPHVVAIATPPFTHYELSVLALNHGCHVYCEKPFMASIKEADQIIALAQQHGRCVGVNSQYYQMPIFRRVQDLLDRGETGRLYHIDAWQHMYLLPDREGGWKAALQPRRVLFEFGTHAVDLMCRLFGALPEAVTARISKVREDVEADVCIDVRLDFPGERGATLSFNRMSHAPMRYFEMRLDCEGAAVRTSLGGVARFDLGWNADRRRPRWRFSFTKGGEARLERAGESTLLATQSGRAIGLAAGAHFAQFRAAIERGEAAGAMASYMREVLRVITACYESASKRGQLIEL